MLHLASPEERAERARLLTLTKDEQLREKASRFGKQLIIPSYANEGEEAACTRCRDLGWTARDVPVGHPDFGEAFMCTDCDGDGRHERMLAVSGLAEGATNQKTLASYKPNVHIRAMEAHAAAAEFAGPEGLPWLCLTGGTGSGKTHLARAVGHEFLRSGAQVRYFQTSALVPMMHKTQRSGSEEHLSDLLDLLTAVPLLILDDFGMESLTPWITGQLEGVLTGRHSSLAPTVITSNLSPANVQRVSQRIYSRMCDRQVCTWVDMKGVADYRQVRKQSRNRGAR